MPPDLAALDLLTTPVWLIALRDGSIHFANRAARALSPAVDLAPLRHGPFSAHAHDSLEAYLPALALNQQVVEIWTVHPDGQAAPLSCRLSPLNTDDGASFLIAEGLNPPEITPFGSSLAAASGEHPEARRFYEMLFRTNSAPMLLIDPADDGRIIDANHAAARFYGYSREQLARLHTWEINTKGQDILPVMHEVAKLPGGHKPLNFEHKLADGSTRYVQTYAGPLELDGKRLMLCIIHDITEQKRLEQELEEAALRDPLTGLWNRRQFLYLVDHAQAQIQRYGQRYSLMMIDADYFKAVNDRYGHHVGDRLLIVLARNIEARVRDSDSVCRWGGEEFVVLLPQTDLAGAVSVAESIRATVAHLVLDDLPHLTVSIGVAEILPDEDNASLFARADEALYRAKAAGRNNVVAAQPAQSTINPLRTA